VSYSSESSRKLGSPGNDFPHTRGLPPYHALRYQLPLDSNAAMSIPKSSFNPQFYSPNLSAAKVAIPGAPPVAVLESEEEQRCRLSDESRLTPTQVDSVNTLRLLQDDVAMVPAPNVGPSEPYQVAGGTSPEAAMVIDPTLSLSLEILFRGCKKRYRVNRNAVEDSIGETSPTTKEVEVDIKPGYKAGTKIKFSRVGSIDQKSVMGLHFIIIEVRESDLTGSECY